MNAPGGCNAGFLRDDALLMVTFIGGYDYDSKGNPDLWAIVCSRPRAVIRGRW
jgi:hypothetical protein